MFEKIELVKIDDSKYALRGISAQTFVSDVARIYRYELNPEDSRKNKLFFNFTVSGVLLKQASIIFNKYFALDVYFIIEKLYDITRRGVYKDALDVLLAERDVGKYFEKPLSLPGDAVKKMGELPVKLFDFQERFIFSYYNARKKLGLDGFILSYLAGGGKTFTAIATSYIFNLCPAIITAPKSTLDGWKKSIIKMYGNKIEENEVHIIHEYNPRREKKKWKFMICNYERIEEAHSYSEYAVSKPVALFIDEAHNFRNMKANRVQSLINVKESLGIHDVIAISATPIKSLSVELVPILRLIDPNFTEEAQAIFTRIYSRMNYDTITGSIIKNRLSIYMERYTDNSSLNLPPLEQYNVYVKLKDPEPFLIETVKNNVYKYVQEHLADARGNVRPNYEKIKQMLEHPVFSNTIDSEEIKKYLRLVLLKIEQPLDKEAIESMDWIKSFEKNELKSASPQMAKEITELRKRAVYYVAILLGKAMGIFFIQGKIKLLIQMVAENTEELIRIIKNSEMKTIMFATFAQPLEPIRNLLEKAGVGCVLHVGGMDVRETMGEFANNPQKMVFLATSQSVGTGTDGLQNYANQIIFLNTSYRYVDVEQNIARVHRKGQPAKVVRIYFMHLDTGETHNILERENEILEWSRAVVRLAIAY